MTKEEIIKAAERFDHPDEYHNIIGASRATADLANGKCEICHAAIRATRAVIEQMLNGDGAIKWHLLCRPCMDVVAIHFNAPVMARFRTEHEARQTLTDITSMRPGDYVKDLGGQLHEIKEIWGVRGNQLAKPSEGGFGCVTTDGLRIDMFHARAYIKRGSEGG